MYISENHFFILVTNAVINCTTGTASHNKG